MKNLKLSFIFLFVTFICVANSNPLLGFIGKRSDDKVEEGDSDGKVAISIPASAKSASESATTTATPEPVSPCGGLKNFLHICNKNEPTEPPKSIKTRSVPEKDSDDSNDDSDSDDDDDDDDDDDSDESPSEKQKKRETTETSSVVSEPVEGGIVKRQVGDPEAPVLGDVPPVISEAVEPSENPIENSEEDKAEEKRQVEDSNPDSDSDDDKTEEILLESRRRRDCSDRNENYDKNCRRKREYVPSCFDENDKNCKPTTN